MNNGMNTGLISADSPHRASLQSTTGRIAAVATALLLVLFLVLSVSRAAFTATTSNPDNSVTTNAITLTDNDNGVALFSITGASPNVATVKCINVRYEGAFTSGDINLFATPTSPATAIGDLGAFLDVKVESQPLGDVALVDDEDHGCNDFNGVAGAPAVVYNSTLGAFPGDYATGATAFTGTQSTYAFRVTVSVQNNPEAAGKAANWDFVWETQGA